VLCTGHCFCYGSYSRQEESHLGNGQTIEKDETGAPRKRGRKIEKKERNPEKEKPSRQLGR
jgi:hypothetical protein